MPQTRDLLTHTHTHMQLWCPLAAERPNSKEHKSLLQAHCHPFCSCLDRTSFSKLTPAVSELVFLLFLLLWLVLLVCLSASARNLCERVRVSLSHMGHHKPEEAGAGGKGLGRFTVRRLPRPSLGIERIIRGSSEREPVFELKSSSEERANVSQSQWCRLL